MFREKSRYRLEEHKRWEEELKRKKEAGEFFCKACGSTISKDYTHCPKCGNFLIGDEKVKSKEKTANKKPITNKAEEDLFKEFKLPKDKKVKKEQPIKIHIEKQKKSKKISLGHIFLMVLLGLMVGGLIGGYFALREKDESIGEKVIVEDKGHPLIKTFDKYPDIIFEINSKDYEKLLKNTPREGVYTTKYLTSNKDNIKNLAKSLEVQAKEKNVDVVKYVIKFVQDLDYVYDTRTGYDEFPKFPEQTIYEQNGDCEDTSYVLYSLLEALGYDVVVAYLPSHAMVGIACEPTGLCGNMWWNRKNKEYFPIESTAGDGSFGYSSFAEGKQATFLKNEGTENFRTLKCFQKEIKHTEEVPLQYDKTIVDKSGSWEWFNTFTIYTIKISNKDSESGNFVYTLTAVSDKGRTYEKQDIVTIGARSSKDITVKFDTEHEETVTEILQVTPTSKTVEKVEYETHCE